MATFTLTFNLDSEAFNPSPDQETIDILKSLAYRIREYGMPASMPIFDVNGNQIGMAGVESCTYRYPDTAVCGASESAHTAHGWYTHSYRS